MEGGGQGGAYISPRYILTRLVKIKKMATAIVMLNVNLSQKAFVIADGNQSQGEMLTLKFKPGVLSAYDRTSLDSDC